MHAPRARTTTSWHRPLATSAARSVLAIWREVAQPVAKVRRLAVGRRTGGVHEAGRPSGRRPLGAIDAWQSMMGHALRGNGPVASAACGATGRGAFDDVWHDVVVLRSAPIVRQRAPSGLGGQWKSRVISWPQLLECMP